MGLTMKEKEAVTREYITRYQAAAKKAKSDLLDEFTRLTRYHRKSAIQLLSGKPVREILLYNKGEAVKLRPAKKRPANRKGKRVYTDEVIAALRLIWAFFWYPIRAFYASEERKTPGFWQIDTVNHCGLAPCVPRLCGLGRYREGSVIGFRGADCVAGPVWGSGVWGSVLSCSFP